MLGCNGFISLKYMNFGSVASGHHIGFLDLLNNLNFH